MFSLKRWMTLWIICSAYFCAGTGNARRSADAIPRHLQGQNRIHVRRRSLACVEQWRRGSPDHLPCRGRELFPKFSPDGKWIAFTAQYDGNFKFALYGLDSKWLIENKGVQPEIVIENRPDLVVKGQDPQLEKAMEMVMKEIQANPKKLPPRPPDLPAYPEGPGM